MPAATTKQPIPGPVPHTPDWYALRVFDPDRAERPVVFGASEAQKAVETPLELYLLKRGEMEPPEQTEDMEVGSLMEPVVLEMYRRRSGNFIHTGCPMYFAPECAFMAATPDAIGIPEVDDMPGVLNLEAVTDFWGVDAKTSHDRMFIRHAAANEDTNKYGEDGTDLVPTYVLWQMQQQCAVMGFPFVDVPVLFGRKYRQYRVDRDETLIKALVDAEKELAERIVNGDPPEPNWTHPNTRECLQALHGLQRGTTVVLSDDGYERWLDIARRKSTIAELEEANREDTNRILAEMESAENALFPAGGREIHRSVIACSHFGWNDVANARRLIGQVKRKGYEKLTERQTKNRS